MFSNNFDKDFHYRSVLRLAFKLIKLDYQLFVSHKHYRALSCIAKSHERRLLEDDLNRLETSLKFMHDYVIYLRTVNKELLRPRKYVCK